MSIDGVKQNENICQTRSSGSARNAQQAAAPNSVYDTAQQTSAESSTSAESTDKTVLDRQFEKLCRRLKRFGITEEDIKKSNILYNVSGLTEEQLEKVPKDKLKKIFDAVESAIKDSMTDKKVNWEKASSLGKDYLVALATGWSIEGFKKHNNSVKKSTLLERLIETGCLPKDTDIKTASMEELKAAIRKFNHILLGNIEKKTNERQVKAQLQTFGRLLINSPAEEKELFLEVIKSLYAENRAQGLDAVMTSCETKEAKESLAKKAGKPEYIREITTEPIRDAEGNILNDDPVSQEDATEIGKIIAENQSEADRAEAHKEYDKARDAWYEKNKETLESIQQKIKQAEENGVAPEFTDEEKRVLLEKQNFIIGVSSGEFIGTVENINISDEKKEELLDILNRDGFKLPDYKNIIKNIKVFAENNQEKLLTTPDKLTKTLDKATNGNYTKIPVEGNDTVELNPPVDRTPTNDNIPDVGFTQRETVDTTRLIFLQQQIKDSAAKNTEFRVEKNVSEPREEVNPETFSAKMAEANSGRDKLAVIKEFFDKSPMLKVALEKYLTGVTDSLTILNALPTNARKYLAQKLTRKVLLQQDDIQKLNLSYNDKQLLLKTFEEVQKQTRAAV